MKAHERLVADQVARKAGRLVKALSDGCLAVFSSTRRAAECAAPVQRTTVHVQDHHPEPFKLKGGQIFAGGVFDMASERNFWVIMGGTGEYKGATGELDATTTSADTFEEVSRFGD